MRVLVAADALPPAASGGIPKSLLTELRGLVDRGHDVVALTRRLDADAPLAERRDGFRQVRYRAPSRESPLYLTYPLASLGQFPRVAASLHERVGFDVAYVHNAFQQAGLLRAGVDVPTLYAFHAPVAEEVRLDADRGKYAPATQLARAAARGFAHLERRAVRDANAVLTRSAFTRETMRREYGPARDSRTVPLAVDTERFAYEPKPGEAREALGLAPDRPTLLTVRRLVARMGVEALVDAMALVRERHPGARLLVAGDGYLREDLAARVAARDLTGTVDLLGFVPEAALPAHYAAADLFVLPTRSLEGFGLATIEALSCGTPVLATPVGANPEVVGGLDEALLTEGTDAAALAAGVDRWLGANGGDRGTGEDGATDDRPGLGDLRPRARRYCEANFAREAVVDELETALAAVAGERATSGTNETSGARGTRGG